MEQQKNTLQVSSGLLEICSSVCLFRRPFSKSNICHTHDIDTHRHSGLIANAPKHTEARTETPNARTPAGGQ